MKRSPSPTNRTARFPAAALVVAVLTMLSYTPITSPAAAQEAHRGAGGGGGVSVGDEVFAGDGCARVGDVVAGDCAKGKSRGKDGASGANRGGSSGGGSGEGQYKPEDGSEGETATSEGGPGDGVGEATQSTTIESTTGLVEESGEATDAGAGAGYAGRPEPPQEPVPGTSEGSVDEGCEVEGPTVETTRTTVERAVDGDTVETPEGTVRLIGVDTPETVDGDEKPEPGGEQASEFTAAGLEGEEVGLEFGEDREDDFGRALAYVWVDGGMFNESLLREGLGELLIVPPNDRYEPCLAAAEKQARDGGLGIWAEGGGTVPATPSANEESEEQPSGAPTRDQYAGEETAPDGPGGEAEPIVPGPADPSPTEGQYEDAAAQPWPRTDPGGGSEVQEPMVQDPEVQDPPVPGDELAPDASPAPAGVNSEVASVEAPAAEPDDPASSVSASSGPASSAGPAITTLPETGGIPPAVRIAPLVLGALLVSGGLLCACVARPGRNARGDDAGATGSEG